VLAPGGRIALSAWRTLEHNPVHEAINESVVRHLGTTALAAAFSGNAQELEALLSGNGFEDIAIEPVTMTVRFPSANRFVRLSALAGAAVSPVVAELDEAERATLVDVIQQDVGATLQSYPQDDDINVPMAAYVATAHIPASSGTAGVRSQIVMAAMVTMPGSYRTASRSGSQRGEDASGC
jgi:hypothetical protein